MKRPLKQALVLSFLPLLVFALTLKFNESRQILHYACFFILFYLGVLWDFRQQIIPDWIPMTGMLAGTVLSIWLLGWSWWMPLLGIVIAGGLMLAIAYVRYGKIGGGDVKLAGMMGAFLGHQLALTSLLTGAIVGFILGAILIGTGRLEKNATVPFAPFLFVGSIIGVFLFSGY